MRAFAGATCSRTARSHRRSRPASGLASPGIPVPTFPQAEINLLLRPIEIPILLCKQKMVEAFSANCSDQSFNERMREGNEGYRFDFRHVEDSQIRLPLMESI